MRVLIATVTAGAGHLQAATALESAWKSLYPDDQVQKVDLLDFVSRIQRKICIDGYVQLVEHAPELWSLVFKKTDNLERLQQWSGFRRQFAQQTNRRFIQHLQEFQPDVVICPHFMPLEILGGLRSTTPGPHPFTVCVVTDFEAHAFWIEPVVDLYCVAAQETKASLEARGVPPERVAATGIPVGPKFATPSDPEAVRLRYGLREDQPVILVLGGGFGMGPVAEILEAIDPIARPIQIIVVAGRNEALRREVAGTLHRQPITTQGFVTNMNDLMSVSELIITKPGGMTASEALGLGKPLFIYSPIPGQEAANSDFLLEHGAATKVNRLEDIPHRLGQLLGSEKLKEMARAAQALGRPQAAQDICRQIKQRWDAEA
jgi:processive 1,2-diacylglycerol beta-glucosyltransferase